MKDDKERIEEHSVLYSTSDGETSWLMHFTCGSSLYRYGYYGMLLSTRNMLQETNFTHQDKSSFLGKAALLSLTSRFYYSYLWKAFIIYTTSIELLIVPGWVLKLQPSFSFGNVSKNTSTNIREMVNRPFSHNICEERNLSISWQHHRLLLESITQVASRQLFDSSDVM